METLKEKTARGLFWGGMNTLVMQLIGMVFGIIMARILDTEDYGMMAAVVIFTAIATELKDSGFKTALANESHPQDADYNSVFWFNLMMGIALYVVMFFSAPLLGAYYENEALVPLARYAFLAVVITAFSTSQSAWLFKNLRTKQIAKAGMTATLLSCLAGVGMALAGGRYWSLVTQNLVFVLVNTLLLWHYSPWRPHLELDFRPVRRMFGFSWKVMVTTIATQVNNNIINVLTVKYFGEQKAGVYFQASQWNTKAFSVVQGMVSQVAQPVFVDLRGDGDRQLAALRKLMRFTAFVTFPLLLCLSMVANEFICLTIGSKWMQSAVFLQVLCLSGCFAPLSTLLSNMVLSKGRSDLYLWSTLLLCGLQVGVLFALRRQELMWMVGAYVALNIAWAFVWFVLVSRLTGYRLLSFLKDVLPFALTAVAAALLTVAVTSQAWPDVVLLVVRVAIFGATYLAVMRLAGAQILRESLGFIKNRNK